MGAGKSTARKALVEQGLPNIDLDQVGHDVLLWDTVKSELVETFGEDILGADGEIDRRALAAKAFVSPAETRKLNRITLPRIEEAFTDRVAELEAEGHKAVVVGDMNWQAFESLGESYGAMVKLRYRSRPCACIIEPEDDQRVSLALRSPQPTTAPGQYAVLYDGDTVLGGGMIEEVMHA